MRTKQTVVKCKFFFFSVQLPAGHVDVSVLVAVQLLIEQVTYEKNQAVLQQLHTHLLFNFNIWSKGDFPLRIGQILVVHLSLKQSLGHVMQNRANEG